MAGDGETDGIEHGERTVLAQPQGRAGGAEDPASSLRLAVFTVAGQRYALPLEAAERVLPMVAIAPLRGGPAGVLGAVNVHGEIVPVLDVRRRLGVDPGTYGPESRLLLARSSRRLVAIPADDVAGVAELEAQAVAPPSAVAEGIAGLAGVAAVADGVLLIHDLEAFFSADDERQLAAALGEERQ